MCNKREIEREKESQNIFSCFGKWILFSFCHLREEVCGSRFLSKSTSELCTAHLLWDEIANVRVRELILKTKPLISILSIGSTLLARLKHERII